MPLWEEKRDWELVEAISDLGDDSYDLVARDFWLQNDDGCGFKADFFRYRQEASVVEVYFYQEESSGVRDKEVMQILGEVRDLLLEEGFYQPRLSIISSDSIRTSYTPELEGDYFLDPGVDYSSIKVDLESITPEGKGIEDLERIRCGKK